MRNVQMLETETKVAENVKDNANAQRKNTSFWSLSCHTFIYRHSWEKEMKVRRKCEQHSDRNRVLRWCYSILYSSQCINCTVKLVLGHHDSSSFRSAEVTHLDRR